MHTFLQLMGRKARTDKPFAICNILEKCTEIDTKFRRIGGHSTFVDHVLCWGSRCRDYLNAELLERMTFFVTITGEIVRSSEVSTGIYDYNASTAGRASGRLFSDGPLERSNGSSIVRGCIRMNTVR